MALRSIISSKRAGRKEGFCSRSFENDHLFYLCSRKKLTMYSCNWISGTPYLLLLSQPENSTESWGNNPKPNYNII